MCGVPACGMVGSVRRQCCRGNGRNRPRAMVIAEHACNTCTHSPLLCVCTLCTCARVHVCVCVYVRVCVRVCVCPRALPQIYVGTDGEAEFSLTTAMGGMVGFVSNAIDPMTGLVVPPEVEGCGTDTGCVVCVALRCAVLRCGA